MNREAGQCPENLIVIPIRLNKMFDTGGLSHAKTKRKYK
jgi:hypothetical protein